MDFYTLPLPVIMYQCRIFSSAIKNKQSSSDIKIPRRTTRVAFDNDNYSTAFACTRNGVKTWGGGEIFNFCAMEMSRRPRVKVTGTGIKSMVEYDELSFNGDGRTAHPLYSCSSSRQPSGDSGILNR